MAKQKMIEERRKDMLLVTIYLFSSYGRREEVSHSELVDCLTELQKRFPLGYEFSKKLPYYSYQLSQDLDDLYLHEGYIKLWKRSRRGAPLFPTNFIALWPLGRGYAKKIVETLEQSEMIEALHKSIEFAIENYKKTWGFYAPNRR